MSAPSLKLAIVANDPSGDALGASLLRAMRDRLGEGRLEAVGMGGKLMAAQGCKLLYSIDEVQGWGKGLLSSLSLLLRLLRLRASLLARFREWRPDVFVGIDASDFNLRLARRLRLAGVRTVQYVSPSVWFWRGHRARKVASAVDVLLALYPFEKRCYDGLPLQVEVVGHPLADSHKPCAAADARAELGIAADGKWLGLLFGSRDRELDAIGADIARIARRCHDRMPGLRFVTAASSPGHADMIRALWQRHGPPSPLHVEVGKARRVISASDAVLLCNGTVALEALLLRRPMVSLYRMGAGVFLLCGLLAPLAFLKFLLGRHAVCLPNIMAGRFIVPEFIQFRLREAAAAEKLLELLQSDEAAQRQLSQLSHLAGEMPTGCPSRAASAVLELAAHG